MELLCKGFVFSNRMFRTGFVTGYPCDVWCRGCLHPTYGITGTGISVSHKTCRLIFTHSRENMPGLVFGNLVCVLAARLPSRLLNCKAMYIFTPNIAGLRPP